MNAVPQRKVLIVVTGALSAVDTPMWLGWLRTERADLQAQVVLTRSAHRFVTPAAVTCKSGRPCLIDDWCATGHTAEHVEWEEWMDAAIVYPATFSYLSRLSAGLTDTPSLLALNCTRKPVVVAPSLPPGGEGSPAFEAARQRLDERPGVTVCPTRRGVSVTTGRENARIALALPEVVAHLDELFDSGVEPVDSLTSTQSRESDDAA